ncbi:glycoside hydrolase domain-containing protein [Martelella soudanensis]|uniref:glycoside hydrolase domain-containing protein n=1 Tax=unclassified Martelella TaxID=2629616 RepID=UPI0015DD71C4|nr:MULTISPECIES: glycoside hydrolase domain-containing protein [unclassified Martelella]
MYTIIDTPWNTTTYIPQLKSGGVETVIRYYNLEDSSSLPQKQFQPGEANALAAAGLAMAVVFEQTGGANGQIGDLDAANGSRDAAQALKLAAAIGQPHGSAIYFSVDYDYYESADLQKIEPYFAAVSKALAGAYRLGVYGSGTVASGMQGAGHAELIWLAGSTGWSGTEQMLATDDWALFQSEMDLTEPLAHDGNTASSAFPNFGQFTLGSGLIS